MRSRALVLSAALAFGLAACSGGTDDAADTGDSDVAADSGALTLVGNDADQWVETTKSAAAGTVDMTLVCEGAVPHNLLIEGVEGDAVLAECAGNDEATASADLEAGTYTFYCSIPGHREAGMEGELTVS